MPRSNDRFARIPWLRVARKAALGLVSVAVLYLAVLNVFLRTTLLRALTDKAGRSFHLEYTHAYTWVPWRAYAEGVKIRGGDSGVEWTVEIDRANFILHPFELLRKRFKASDIQAEGVVFRIRLLESERSPEHEARLPAIDGFHDPPLKPIGPQPTLTDAQYNLFSVDLEGVTAKHVREIWIDTTRFTGDLTVRGRWFFRPERHLEVGPTEVDLANVAVAPGLEAPFVTDASGHFELTIHPYDPREPTLVETLRYVSLGADLKGQMNAAHAFADYAPPAWGIAVPRGDGTFIAHPIIERGLLAPGTTTSFSFPTFEVTRGPLTLAARIEGRSHVDPGPGAPRGATDLTLSDVRLTREAVNLTRVDTIDATLSTTNLDVAEPAGEVFYETALTGIVAPHLDPLSALLPAGMRIASGASTAHAELKGSLTKETGSGTLDVSVKQLSLAHEAMGGTGDVEAHVRLHDVDLRQKSGDFGGSTVDLRRGQGHVQADLSVGVTKFAATIPALHVDDAGVRGSVTLQAEGGTLDARGFALSGGVVAQAGSFRVGSIAGGADVEVVDASVRVDTLEAKSEGERTLLAHAPTLTATSRTVGYRGGEPRGTVSFDVPSLDVLSLEALARLVRWPASFAVTGGSAAVSTHGTVDLTQRALEVAAHVASHQLRVRTGSQAVTADATVDLTARRRSGDDRTILNGSRVALDHVNGGGAHDWWARVALGPSVVAFSSGGPSGELTAHVDAMNATPADPLIAQASGVPKWVLGIVSLPNLRADGTVSFGGGRLEVRDVQVHGGESSVRVELSNSETESRGLILVKLGLLSAGFGVGSERPSVVLIDAPAWFEARRSALARERDARPANGPTASGRPPTATQRAPATATEATARIAAVTTSPPSEVLPSVAELVP